MLTRKVRETMPEKGDAPMRYIKRLCVQYAGLTEDAVNEWLGEKVSEATISTC